MIGGLLELLRVSGRCFVTLMIICTRPQLVLERNIRPPRYTPIFHTIGREIFLFGGYTEDRLGTRKLNHAWFSDRDIWQPLEMTVTSGYTHEADWSRLRYGCMSVVVDGDIFVNGGFSDKGDHKDLWCFRMADRWWQLIAPESLGPETPAARYCAAFAYYEGKLFLFGGRSRRYPKLNFNDLWVFDLGQKKWRCLDENRTPHLYDARATFPVYHAKASTAIVGGYRYLWSGEGLSGHVSDFWLFSFDTSRWELLKVARDDDPIFW